MARKTWIQLRNLPGTPRESPPAPAGSARARMSRIEIEAQRLLMQRRESLGRPPEVPPLPHPVGWSDFAATPGQMPEERRRELEAVEAALRRITDGSYGTCLACGGPLGLQRIRAIPEAKYCLSCSGTRDAAD